MNEIKGFKGVKEQVKVVGVICYSNQGHIFRVTYSISGHESHVMKRALNKAEKRFVAEKGLVTRQRIYIDC